MQMTHPTQEQLDALEVFRAENGPAWKVKLLDGWQRAKYPGHLQALRNQFGPAWLIAWKPGQTRVGWLRQVPNTGARATRPYHYEVQDADGHCMLTFPSKVMARSVCPDNLITLLEEE
jgi:hypothetical protein